MTKDSSHGRRRTEEDEMEDVWAEEKDDGG